MGLFNLFKSVQNNNNTEKTQLAVEKENDIDKLLKFEKEGNYEEYVNTLKKIGLSTQIEIVSNLENEICLQKIAMSEIDTYTANVAMMRIQDVNFLIEIIALHKWDSSNIGEIGMLRLIDFEVTEKIKNFLNSIKDNNAYESGIRRIAKVMLKNQQLVRDVKVKAYYPRCATEPIKWFVNIAQNQQIVSSSISD